MFTIRQHGGAVVTRQFLLIFFEIVFFALLFKTFIFSIFEWPLKTGLSIFQLSLVKRKPAFLHMRKQSHRSAWQ